MRRLFFSVVAALGLILASISWPGGAHGPAPAVAQADLSGDEDEDEESPPVDALSAPAVTGGVFADALKAETVFAAGICPTGLAGGQYEGEGFALIVEGRCAPTQDAANIAVTGRGITIGDGDLALNVKVAENAPRAGVNLYVRNRDAKLMAAYLDFGAGRLELFRRESATNTVVASRDDLGDLVNPGDWNRVALRTRGDEIWLLLNDEPVLHAAGVLDQAGGVGIGDSGGTAGGTPNLVERQRRCQYPFPRDDGGSCPDWYR